MVTGIRKNTFFVLLVNVKMNQTGILVIYVFGAILVLVIVICTALKFGVSNLCYLGRKYLCFKRGSSQKFEPMAWSTAFRPPRSAITAEEGVNAVPIVPLVIVGSANVLLTERDKLEQERVALVDDRNILISQFRNLELAYREAIGVAITEQVEYGCDFLLDEICLVNGHLVCEITRIVDDDYFEVISLDDGITEYSAETKMLARLPRPYQANIRKIRRDKLDLSRQLEESSVSLAHVIGKIQEIDKPKSVTPRSPNSEHTPPTRRLGTPPKLRVPVIGAIPPLSDIDLVRSEMKKLQNASIDEKRKFYKSLLLKYHPDKNQQSTIKQHENIFQFIQESKQKFLS